MSHSVTTIEHRTAALTRVKPTIADLKKFIAETEEAGIKDSTKVRIEKIGEIIGFTYSFQVEQRDEVPQLAPMPMQDGDA